MTRTLQVPDFPNSIPRKKLLEFTETVLGIDPQSCRSVHMEGSCVRVDYFLLDDQGKRIPLPSAERYLSATIEIPYDDR